MLVAPSSYSVVPGETVAHELRGLSARAGQPQTAKGGLAPWQLRQVTTYIEQHLAEPISLGTLARLARLSPYHFCRAFRQSLGLPPHRYHSRRRSECAKHLLARPAASVTQVGLTVGYSETSSFTAAFHKAVGLTPTAYRRSLPGFHACEELRP